MKISKKLLIVPVLALAVAGTGAVFALNNSPKTTAEVVPPIVQQVQHQGKVLDNHEARLTNAEKDIAGLQSNTATAPSPSKIEVPVVPQIVQAPTPVTVTAYQEVPIADSEDIDCKLTYSDSTTYQWHWRTVRLQGSWVTDGMGNNGHWVKVTGHSGSCSQGIVGSVKA